MAPRTTAALILTIVFWASAFPGIRAALETFSPAHLGFFRFSVASLALLAIWIVRRPPLPRKEDVPGILVLGGVGIACYNWALNTGSLTVSSGVAGLLVNTAPIWIAVIASVALRERAGIRAWTGLLIAFLGAALIASRRGGAFGLNHGALLVLGASVCHAIYITLQKKFVSTYGAIGTTCYAVWTGTAFLALGANGLPAAVTAAPLSASLLIVYLGVVPAALAYVSWAYVLNRLPASRAAGFLFLVPVGAFVIGWLWLGEVPTAQVMIGAAMVFLGVAMVQTGGTAAEVVFDGHCELCRRSAAIISSLDWFGNVSLSPLQDPDTSARCASKGISAADTRREIHLLEGDNIFRGFFAIRRLCLLLPVLLPIAPLLFLPGASRIGTSLYRFVAEHRR